MGIRENVEHKKQLLRGVFFWDIVENIVRGDSVFAGFYGLDRDEADSGVPIERLLERIAPEDLPRIAKRIHESITDGASFEETFCVIRPVQGNVQVKVYSNCFHEVEGFLTHCAGSICEDDLYNHQRPATKSHADNVFSISQQPSRIAGRQDNSIMASVVTSKPN